MNNTEQTKLRIQRRKDVTTKDTHMTDIKDSDQNQTKTRHPKKDDKSMSSIVQETQWGNQIGSSTTASFHHSTPEQRQELRRQAYSINNK